MSRAGEINWLLFLQSYEELKPEDQDFMARVVEGLAARIKSDPEADRMLPLDLVREVVQEVAPSRVDQFDRLTASRPA